MNTERDTGITTRQMQAAPQGAIFVWCNSNTYYPTRLALHLGRADLRVEPKSWINARASQNRRSLVIDHACVLTQRERAILWTIGWCK